MIKTVITRVSSVLLGTHGVVIIWQFVEACIDSGREVLRRCDFLNFYYLSMINSIVDD